MLSAIPFIVYIYFSVIVVVVVRNICDFFRCCLFSFCSSVPGLAPSMPIDFYLILRTNKHSLRIIHTHTHIPPMLLFLLTYQTVNMAFENSHSIWHAQIAAWCCNNLCNMCVACSFWCCSFVVVTPTHQYTHIVTHSKWWPHTIDFYEKREYRNIAKQENMTRSIMCDVNNRLITRENMFVLLNFVWLVHRYFGHDNFLGFSSFFFCLSWQILASWSNTQLFEQLIPSILTGNDSARILEYSNYVGSLFSCDGFCCCYRWQSNCTSNWNQGKPQDICRINH